MAGSGQAASLDAIVFPTTVSAGEVYSQYGAHNATVTHVYTFDAGDAASGVYNVVVTDRATNQTTVPFSVFRDAIAPTVTLTVAERIAASDIPVQWTAVEDGSGVQHYDVEYQIANGDWTPWLTATTQMQATFTSTLGVAYTFRVRATDRVNNISAWVQAVARTVVVKKYYSVAGQRVAMRSNGVLYYLHTDHLGSTSLTTDESGSVIAEQKYLPYGEVGWMTGTLPTDFGFTGQRAEDFGLMDYRARFYSGRLGRFVSADSIVPGAGGAAQNRYMYVEGNPLKYVDPSGHCAGLTGMAFRVCKAMVMTAAQVVHKANEYREDIFFPDENTTFLERLEASTVVGGVSTAVAVGTTWAVKKVASYAITHPKKAYTGRAFAEEAYEAAVTGTPFDPGMVLLDLASAGILDDTLPRRQRPNLYRDGGDANSPNFQIRTPNNPYPRTGEWDITLDADGYVGPGSGGWSTRSVPRSAQTWMYPGDAPEPEGVRIYQDKPGDDPTHWSWEPAYQMPYTEFKKRVKSSRPYWIRSE